MYSYYNAHPKGLRVNDCVKRAIARATGMDYHQVQLELNRYKKVTGAKTYNSDYNPHKYVENVLKGVKLSFPAKKGCSRMNGKRFCEAYPQGNYILNMAGHWRCCIDGVIYDTWDCSEKCVYTAYQLKAPERKCFTSVMKPVSRSQHNITYTSMEELKTVLRKDFELFLQNLHEGDAGVTFRVEI